MQGYLEIDPKPILTEAKVKLIAQRLASIEQQKGVFTDWLDQVCTHFSDNGYRPAMLAFFLPIITKRLNDIFLHVIDESYDTDLSHEALLAVHNGETP